MFLDTLLVLTKQDRLCHCIFSTSDSFFQHFLRRLNVGQHCAVYTVADPSRAAAYGYFMDELIMRYPADLRPQVNFDEIFDVFGGKLSHISDFVDAVVNADGSLSPLTSSIFVSSVPEGTELTPDTSLCIASIPFKSRSLRDFFATDNSDCRG